MFSKKELQTIERLNRRKHIPLAQNSQRTNLDFTPYLAIINHPLFQRLKYLRQLSNAHIVFPGATHSREEHSLDAACWQEGRNRFWLKYKMINKQDAICLIIFALLHDVTHGPTSHVLDRVFTKNHDARALPIIKKMRLAIEACGAPYQRMKALFLENDPLYIAVKHHPLGTDKLSYLRMDAIRCGLEPPNLSRLPNYVFWLRGQLMVHVNCDLEALELKRFYINMYRQVYFLKSCLIGQRILEKEIFALAQSGKLNDDALWRMTDEELSAEIRRTKRGRYGYDRYQHLASKTVVSCKLYGLGLTENTSGKPIVVFEKDRKFFNTIRDNSSIPILEQKERELARELKIDPADLDIVPPMGTHRFVPKPITILNGRETFTDVEKYPKQHEALKELADTALSLRVCVTKHLREALAKKAGAINEFLDDWIKSMQPG